MGITFTRRAWIRSVPYSGIALACGAGYVSSKRLETVYANVPLAGLPKRLNGITIGALADFHAGAFTTRDDIRRDTITVTREQQAFTVTVSYAQRIQQPNRNAA